MNEDVRRLFLEFIDHYEKAVDKEAFIQMWKEFFSASEHPLTIQDGYDEAYGQSIIQVLASEEC